MLGLAILLGAHAFASHKKDASKVHLAISTFRHGSRTFMDLSPAQLDTPAGQAAIAWANDYGVGRLIAAGTAEMRARGEQLAARYVRGFAIVNTSAAWRDAYARSSDYDRNMMSLNAMQESLLGGVKMPVFTVPVEADALIVSARMLRSEATCPNLFKGAARRGGKMNLVHLVPNLRTEPMEDPWLVAPDDPDPKEPTSKWLTEGPDPDTYVDILQTLGVPIDWNPTIWYPLYDTNVILRTNGFPDAALLNDEQYGRLKGLAEESIQYAYLGTSLQDAGGLPLLPSNLPCNAPFRLMVGTQMGEIRRRLLSSLVTSLDAMYQGSDGSSAERDQWASFERSRGSRGKCDPVAIMLLESSSGRYRWTSSTAWFNKLMPGLNQGNGSSAASYDRALPRPPKALDPSTGCAARFPEGKLVLYSGHDTTATALLIALGGWDGTILTWGTMITIELITVGDDDKGYVRAFVSTDADEDAFAEELPLRECTERTAKGCPLRAFLELIDKYSFRDGDELNEVCTDADKPPACFIDGSCCTVQTGTLAQKYKAPVYGGNNYHGWALF